MENVLHWVAGLAVAGLLVVAAPGIVYQATSDDGDWHSGATPDCPTWNYDLRGGNYEIANTLTPTVEREVGR